MTTWRVVETHEEPDGDGRSPSTVVVIRITVELPAQQRTEGVDDRTAPNDSRWRPVTNPQGCQVNGELSGATAPDVGRIDPATGSARSVQLAGGARSPTAIVAPPHVRASRRLPSADIELTDAVPAATVRRRPIVKPKSPRNRWPSLAVVAAALMIGTATWASAPRPALTAALAPNRRAVDAGPRQYLTGPGGASWRGEPIRLPLQMGSLRPRGQRHPGGGNRSRPSKCPHTHDRVHTRTPHRDAVLPALCRRHPHLPLETSGSPPLISILLDRGRAPTAAVSQLRFKPRFRSERARLVGKSQQAFWARFFATAENICAQKPQGERSRPDRSRRPLPELVAHVKAQSATLAPIGGRSHTERGSRR